MLKTFFIDYDISIKDKLIEIIESYSGIKEWMLSHEEYNKEGVHKPHFHFYFKVDNVKTFNNVIKKIIGDFNLKELGKQIRETTGKKGYRNYGALTKKIYNEEYYKTYLAKDQTIWGNYPKDQLQSYIDASYKLETEKEFKEKCYIYVNKNYLKDKYKDIVVRDQLGSNHLKSIQIKLCIMDYMRQNDSTITKTKVNNHFNYFLTKNQNFSLSQIYCLLDIDR